MVDRHRAETHHNRINRHAMAGTPADQSNRRGVVRLEAVVMTPVVGVEVVLVPVPALVRIRVPTIRRLE